MPINTTHPQYDSLAPRWRRMTDVCNGEDAIKKAGERYLPMPNKDIRTPEAMARYENYKDRSVFVEVTKDTLDKYTGQAFKDDPVLNVDPQLDYMMRDANGAGLSIYQIAQKAFEAQLERGRFGFFVDYPATDGEVSQADVERKALRPTINYYSPESIINWRTTVVGGQTVTTLIVLHETVYETDPDDIFASKQIEQWRYLGLDETGYFVEVWRKNDGTIAGNKESFVLHQDRIYPTRSNNTKFERIPFVIGGSDANDWCEQNIPLESLAKMNLAHYRNSADYEQSAFICGQVQPWMSGVSETRMKALEAQKIRIGSGAMIMLEENGKFGFAQAEPNGLAGEAMDKKYLIMQALGAKLSEAQTVQKTATQSNHESGVQNSTASMCIANLNEAMQDALLMAYEYMGIDTVIKDGEYLFKAKQDFVSVNADGALMTAIGGWVSSGLAPKSVAYNYQRKYNLIDAELKDDEIDELIDAELPSPVAKAFDDE